MIELILTPEQKLLLADVIDVEMQRCREDCWLFSPGEKDWNDLVTRAKALQGLLAEIESA